jgi:5-methylthioadenosine/S-adenosylhomocysteine deaminase
MPSLLIKDVLLTNQIVDVLIQDGRFARIGPDIAHEAGEIIDGQGKAILPSLANGHTHAAMSLLRGFADDLELHVWLQEHIWPLEARLSEDDVYIGAKLACLEMIKSGTTFFNDMYWHLPGTARAVEEMGLRADLSLVFIDFQDSRTADQNWKKNQELYAACQAYSDRIRFALGPHAVYTVSRESLLRLRDFALEKNLLIHMHCCETHKEVLDAREQFGRPPVAYLHELGLLGPNLCAVHAVWLDQAEVELLAASGAKVVHCPSSNMKLCSGGFPYPRLQEAGVCIGLGTDGCSSNNNLDMFEEMKIASLLAKDRSGDPTALPAGEVFARATQQAADIFGLDAGRIEEGRLADCILVELNHPRLVPNHHLISNLVYAANGDCVHTTICNGKVLMHDRVVEGEAEILAQARAAAKRLTRER